MPTTIIGFGYKARRGKDTACSAILEARKSWGNIGRYAFANALRDEIQTALNGVRMTRIVRDGPYDEHAAMRLLCAWAGVPYDPNAVRSPDYPYGKQRALTQWWGTEYRRAQDENYWIKQIKERIERDAPEVALISDLRFHNEYEFIQINGGYCIRVDRPGFEIADGQHHITERALDTLSDDQWDHVLMNDGDEGKLKADAVALFDQLVQW